MDLLTELFLTKKHCERREWNFTATMLGKAILRIKALEREVKKLRKKSVARRIMD